MKYHSIDSIAVFLSNQKFEQTGVYEDHVQYCNDTEIISLYLSRQGYEIRSEYKVA